MSLLKGGTLEIAFSVVVVSIFVILLMAGLLSIKKLGVGFELKLMLAVFSGAGLAIVLFTPQFSRRLKTGLSTNFAATSVSPEFPELKTRFYQASTNQVFSASVAAIQQLSDWTITRQSEGSGVILAEKKVVIFVDDVAVKVRDDRGQTRVDVLSKSRIGKGDFGENRRHVAQFLKALDRELNH